MFKTRSEVVCLEGGGCSRQPCQCAGKVSDLTTGKHTLNSTIIYYAIYNINQINVHLK